MWVYIVGIIKENSESGFSIFQKLFFEHSFWWFMEHKLTKSVGHFIIIILNLLPVLSWLENIVCIINLIDILVKFYYCE